jgi:cytochrome P450
MRITPPVSGALWRELPLEDGGSHEPLIIDGHVVPAGTWVGVNTYAIHHNEDYFPDPFVFQPERWIGKDPADLKTMHDAFSPFGIGAHSCIGKTMVYMEASLTLAKTMWYFDFERPRNPKLDRIGGGTGIPGGSTGREHEKEFQTYDQFTAGHDGPYLNFRPRDELCQDLAFE